MPGVVGFRLRECCGCTEGLQIPGSCSCGGGVCCEPSGRGAPWSTGPDPYRFLSLRPQAPGFRGKRDWVGVVECIPPETLHRIRAVDFDVAAAAGLRGIAFQGPERLGLQTGYRPEKGQPTRVIILPFYISVREGCVCHFSRGRGTAVGPRGSLRQASETRG